MQPYTRAEQKRIDTVCGYALGAYASVTFTWITLLLMPGLAIFGLIMTVVAGFFGLLRGLLLPFRFWIIQAMTLAYPIIAFFDYGANPNAPPLALVGIGMLYSAALSYNLYKIMRYDFAKTVPDWLCEGCGYALVGLTNNKCPECGRPFEPDQMPLIRTGVKSPSHDNNP